VTPVVYAVSRRVEQDAITARFAVVDTHLTHGVVKGRVTATIDNIQLDLYDEVSPWST